MDSMIDKIRAAEKQAEDIRAQAVADARDMAARAREEAAAREKLAGAIAYLMERVDTQV